MEKAEFQSIFLVNALSGTKTASSTRRPKRTRRRRHHRRHRRHRANCFFANFLFLFQFVSSPPPRRPSCLCSYPFGCTAIRRFVYFFLRCVRIPKTKPKPFFLFLLPDRIFVFVHTATKKKIKSIVFVELYAIPFACANKCAHNVVCLHKPRPNSPPKNRFHFDSLKRTLCVCGVAIQTK